MAHVRERPGWASPVPVDLPDARYVECGACHRSMPWRTFVNGHLRECDGPDDRKGSTRGHDASGK